MSTNVDVLETLASEPMTGETTTSEAFANEMFPDEPSTRGETAPLTASAPPAPVALRDAADVRTILSLTMAGIVLALLTLLMAGVLSYKVLSSPPVIVVDRTKEGDRVVSMDGRMLAAPVSVSTELPGDGDKKYAANTYASYLYQIDPATRSADLERAIKMMVPAAAVELMRQLKPDLELQRRERWQSTWEPQVTSIDPLDPYTVRVVGRQQITKVVHQEAQQWQRQLAFNLKLVFDSQRRAERNDRTGFLIADLRDFQIVSDQRVADEPHAASASVPQMPRPGQFVVPQP